VRYSWLTKRLRARVAAAIIDQLVHHAMSFLSPVIEGINLRIAGSRAMRPVCEDGDQALGGQFFAGHKHKRGADVQKVRSADVGADFR
jgi:hypothetical protein